MAPKPVPVDPEILKQRRQELAKRLVEMNAKKREEKLQEDEALLKSLGKYYSYTHKTHKTENFHVQILFLSSYF